VRASLVIALDQSAAVFEDHIFVLYDAVRRQSAVAL
jgi:hypothetical protein